MSDILNDIALLFGIFGINEQMNLRDVKNDFLFNSPMMLNPAYW